MSLTYEKLLEIRNKGIPLQYHGYITCHFWTENFKQKTEIIMGDDPGIYDQIKAQDMEIA